MKHHIYEIGDRVVSTGVDRNGPPMGTLGTVFTAHSEAPAVSFDGWDEGWSHAGQRDRSCWGCDSEWIVPHEDITPPPHVLPTFIVCVIDQDGTPLPSERPVVHKDLASAQAEGARLAQLHGGQVFGVFAMMSSFSFKPVLLHQNMMAPAGQ